MRLFHRNQTPLMDTPRSDGYTDYNARIVCAFQAAVENSPTCDYEAIRTTLAWARQQTSVKLTPVGVYAHYEEQVRGWLYSD